jgi:uncharacterized protein (TIGR04255 family)
MPLKLPDLDPMELDPSPLVVVICQVRYEQSLVVSDADTGFKIHEQLGGKDGPYQLIEPVQTMSAQVEIGPFGFGQGMPPGIQTTGWRLLATDRAWTVTIFPDNIALETTAYRGWKADFKERFRSLLEAIAKHVNPTVEQRVGLRYANRITAENRKDPKNWLDVIAPELLSPLGGGFWSDGLVNAQHQLMLDIGEEAYCLMRHGFVSDPTGVIDSYALDYDVFRQSARRFDIDAISASLSHFHRAALAIFCKSLTPDYLDELG